MASSLGKMPTTLVRRLISPLTRSIGFVECSLSHWHGPGLPAALTVTIALGEPVIALLSVLSAGQAAHLKGHQPLRGKADHLAQKVSVGALPHQRLQGHPIVGYR
jgi:hypothetical protein